MVAQRELAELVETEGATMPLEQAATPVEETPRGEKSFGRVETPA